VFLDDGHDGFQGVWVLVAGEIGGDWLFEGFEVGADVTDVGERADGAFDTFGNLMGGGERTLGREFEVQGDAVLVAVIKDRDVVGFADRRFAERARQDPVAQCEPASAGLDVDDDVAVWQDLLMACSMLSAAACPSTTARPGGMATTTSAK
jgi:hypothetical protein